jgi:hypothetical protein
VRTTLTLDDDVAAKLKTEARRTGRPFREVVNHFLRLGLGTKKARVSSPPFVVRARPLGLRAGLDYDRTSELLEQIEGPLAR